MKDAIQLEGELETWNVDVEFSIDGVSAVEVKLDGGIKERELFLEPAFEFGDTSTFGLVGIVPLGSTGFSTEVVLGLFEVALWFRE